MTDAEIKQKIAELRDDNEALEGLLPDDDIQEELDKNLAEIQKLKNNLENIRLAEEVDEEDYAMAKKKSGPVSDDFTDLTQFWEYEEGGQTEYYKYAAIVERRNAYLFKKGLEKLGYDWDDYDEQERYGYIHFGLTQSQHDKIKKNSDILELSEDIQEYGVGGFVVGMLVGGYAGYKIGVLQPQRETKDLLRTEKALYKELKKKKKGKKNKSPKEPEYTEYEDVTEERNYAKGGWIDFKSKREINKIKKELEKKGDTYSIQFDPDGSRFGLKGGGRYRITSGEYLSTTYAKGGKISYDDVYKLTDKKKRFTKEEIEKTGLQETSIRPGSSMYDRELRADVGYWDPKGDGNVYEFQEMSRGKDKGKFKFFGYYVKRGYAKGGKIDIDKIVEKVKNSDDVSTEINTLITEKYGHNPELEDKVMERYYEKYGAIYTEDEVKYALGVDEDYENWVELAFQRGYKYNESKDEWYLPDDYAKGGVPYSKRFFDIVEYSKDGTIVRKIENKNTYEAEDIAFKLNNTNPVRSGYHYVKMEERFAKGGVIKKGELKKVVSKSFDWYTYKKGRAWTSSDTKKLAEKLSQNIKSLKEFPQVLNRVNIREFIDELEGYSVPKNKGINYVTESLYSYFIKGEVYAKGGSIINNPQDTEEYLRTSTYVEGEETEEMRDYIGDLAETTDGEGLEQIAMALGVGISEDYDPDDETEVDLLFDKLMGAIEDAPYRDIKFAYQELKEQMYAKGGFVSIREKLANMSIEDLRDYRDNNEGQEQDLLEGRDNSELPEERANYDRELQKNRLVYQLLQREFKNRGVDFFSNNPLYAKGGKVLKILKDKKFSKQTPRENGWYIEYYPNEDKMKERRGTGIGYDADEDTYWHNSVAGYKLNSVWNHSRKNNDKGIGWYSFDEDEILEIIDGVGGFVDKDDYRKWIKYAKGGDVSSAWDKMYAKHQGDTQSDFDFREKMERYLENADNDKSEAWEKMYSDHEYSDDDWNEEDYEVIEEMDRYAKGGKTTKFDHIKNNKVVYDVWDKIVDDGHKGLLSKYIDDGKQQKSQFVFTQIEGVRTPDEDLDKFTEEVEKVLKKKGYNYDVNRGLGIVDIFADKTYKKGGYTNPIDTFSERVESQLDCETPDSCDDVIRKQEVKDVIIGGYNRGESSDVVARRLNYQYFEGGGDVIDNLQIVNKSRIDKLENEKGKIESQIEFMTSDEDYDIKEVEDLNQRLGEIYEEIRVLTYGKSGKKTSKLAKGGKIKEGDYLWFDNVGDNYSTKRLKVKSILPSKDGKTHHYITNRGTFSNSDIAGYDRGGTIAEMYEVIDVGNNTRFDSVMSFDDLINWTQELAYTQSLEAPSTINEAQKVLAKNNLVAVEFRQGGAIDDIKQDIKELEDSLQWFSGQDKKDIEKEIKKLKKEIKPAKAKPKKKKQSKEELLEEIEDDMRYFSRRVDADQSELNVEDDAVVFETRYLGNWSLPEYVDEDDEDYHDYDWEKWDDYGKYYKIFKDWGKTQKWYKEVDLDLDVSEKNWVSFAIRLK